MSSQRAKTSVSHQPTMVSDVGLIASTSSSVVTSMRPQPRPKPMSHLPVGTDDESLLPGVRPLPSIAEPSHLKQYGQKENGVRSRDYSSQSASQSISSPMSWLFGDPETPWARRHNSCSVMCVLSNDDDDPPTSPLFERCKCE